MLILSVGMLMFAAKFYHIPDLIDVLKTVIRNNVSIHKNFGGSLF